MDRFLFASLGTVLELTGHLTAGEERRMERNALPHSIAGRIMETWIKGAGFSGPLNKNMGSPSLGLTL
jgi:hypothetical protein